MSFIYILSFTSSLPDFIWVFVTATTTINKIDRSGNESESVKDEEAIKVKIEI